MAMANKIKTMKDRKVIRVPFFNDEYAALGVGPDQTYSEAVTVIRSRTGCVVGPRTREAGVSKAALYKQFDTATAEQKKAINEILRK